MKENLLFYSGIFIKSVLILTMGHLVFDFIDNYDGNGIVSAEVILVLSAPIFLFLVIYFIGVPIEKFMQRNR